MFLVRIGSLLTNGIFAAFILFLFSVDGHRVRSPALDAFLLPICILNVVLAVNALRPSAGGETDAWRAFRYLAISGNAVCIFLMLLGLFVKGPSIPVVLTAITFGLGFAASREKALRPAENVDKPKPALKPVSQVVRAPEPPLDLRDDPKRVVRGLMWALKPSDYSIIDAILQQEQGNDAFVMTTKGSGNDIFWSKLETMGLAKSHVETRPIPPEVQEILKNSRQIGPTAAGREVLREQFKLDPRTGYFPADAQMTQEVVRILKIQAEEGNTMAQHKLGSLYSRGQGVPHDPQEAVRWFGLSAAAGDPIGQNNLGHAYFSGEGVQKDMGEAYHLFSLAAEKGSVGAINNLGMMYSKGLHVARNVLQAIHYYKKAARLGHAEATLNLGALYFQGAGVERDLTRAFLWVSLSLERGVDAHRELRLVTDQMTQDQIRTAAAMYASWKIDPV